MNGEKKIEYAETHNEFFEASGKAFWVIQIGSGYGAFGFYGTEKKAEEYRQHKANWEHAIAWKRLANEAEAQYLRLNPREYIVPDETYEQKQARYEAVKKLTAESEPVQMVGIPAAVHDAQQAVIREAEHNFIKFEKVAEPYSRKYDQLMKSGRPIPEDISRFKEIWLSSRAALARLRAVKEEL